MSLKFANKLLDKYKKIKQNHYDKCYSQMKCSKTNDKCYGLFGGDWETEYLQYECIDCPYWQPIKKGK